jgi:hypothetical protein
LHKHSLSFKKDKHSHHIIYASVASSFTCGKRGDEHPHLVTGM